MKIKCNSDDELPLNKTVEIRVCYYFDEKLYENISVYNISHKTPAGPKSLHIRFDKIDGFIIALDGKNKHLLLFDYGLFNKIYDKIKYLISKKSGITNSINHNLGKIRIDSNNSLRNRKY